MIVFLQNARLIDPETLTETMGNLVIDGGRIAAIGPMSAPPRRAGDRLRREMPRTGGIVDLGVKIGEPGERHKESLRTAGLAAAAGGVTTVIARPDTNPPAIDTPEVLEYVTRRAADAPVRILHMAALTKGREGREMTEIGFLLDAGAVAFTDGDHVSTSTKALARAMTYAKSLGALVIGHPQEPALSAGLLLPAGNSPRCAVFPASRRLLSGWGLIAIWASWR